jgi:hypothetical protein
MKNRQSFVALFWLVVGTLNVPGAAQADTLTVDCSFTSSATPKGFQKEVRPFEFKFLLDTTTMKAYAMGNNGSNEVTLLPGGTNGYTLVEVTATNNVMVTAIAVSGVAVHSRNTLMNKTVVPTQYYGTCARK